ncbi:hypothetical protein J7M22_15460 [Candidatus Poribacteria bacterium]|nr:hypothetical protein [Candidatus Poribacteria bacterium]
MRAGRLDAAHQNIMGNLLSTHRVNRLQDISLSNQENRFIQQLQRAIEESKPKVKSTPQTQGKKVKEREAGGGRHRRKREDEEDKEHKVDLMV